jgi:hypothetical protein
MLRSYTNKPTNLDLTLVHSTMSPTFDIPCPWGISPDRFLTSQNPHGAPRLLARGAKVMLPREFGPPTHVFGAISKSLEGGWSANSFSESLSQSAWLAQAQRSEGLLSQNMTAEAPARANIANPGTGPNTSLREDQNSKSTLTPQLPACQDDEPKQAKHPKSPAGQTNPEQPEPIATRSVLKERNPNDAQPGLQWHGMLTSRDADLFDKHQRKRRLSAAGEYPCRLGVKRPKEDIGLDTEPLSGKSGESESLSKLPLSDLVVFGGC